EDFKRFPSTTVMSRSLSVAAASNDHTAAKDEFIEFQKWLSNPAVNGTELAKLVENSIPHGRYETFLHAIEIIIVLQKLRYWYEVGST
ncbi:MAG: hypothetical protein M1816_007245, partial [Peltula sp. TS41687]